MNHRQPEGQRLKADEGPVVLMRGHYKDVCVRVEEAEILIGLGSKQVDCILKACCLDLHFELGRLLAITSYPDSDPPTNLAREQCGRGHQVGDPFALYDWPYIKEGNVLVRRVSHGQAALSRDRLGCKTRA